MLVGGDEPLVHAERERCEQGPLGRSGERGVPIQRIERQPRRENDYGLVVPRRRRCLRDLLDRGRGRFSRQIAIQQLPVLLVQIGDLLIPNDVCVVRMAEDAVLTEIGGTGPYGVRISAAAPDQELVVSKLARSRASLGQRLDATVRELFLVGLALRVTVVQDLDRAPRDLAAFSAA